ncbi:hypothetical protein LTR05_005697 [Lithohypha guttulata]|uniref:Xylanolytic transcriptional activator regulatory domain-containing protein n=1 Tax=Lithohypha guttulata TaxID=1690604 RepID=A0AAN7SY69_9EURO|nr:hypothetical protein LTR05_005697 [Lithohypha guttulata]
MQDKVADYEKILRDLQSRVSEADAELIQADQLDAEEAILADGAGPIQSVEAGADEEASGAESDVSGGRGSTGALDRTEEDFTREGAKVTGFMGKNSDVTWMQRLRQENKYGEGTPEAADVNARRLNEISGPSLRSHAMGSTNIALPEADQGFTVQDSNYHLNDLAISTYEAVDPYEMPTQEHAQMLFMTYMNRVHPSFPIIGRVNLQNQFAKFMARPINRPPPKWLAIINMIFAIAARYSHLIQADWQADERDHLIYFTRARMLTIDSDTIFNHPDLQMIQIIALMACYMMVVDQINRAWNVLGMAIRASTALGLNMRNDSAELPDGLKEIRYRVWWSMYCLEHRICAMTGRVNCIVDDHCTTPLPVPLNEEEFETEQGQKLLNHEHQKTSRAPTSNGPTPSRPGSTSSSRSDSNKADASNSPSTTQASSAPDWTKDVTPNTSLYFFHFVQLCRLTQNIFIKLYNPTAIQGKWSDLQNSIKDLSTQLESWYRRLPAAFDFRRKQRDRDFYESRLGLGFYYYSTKMMLHRPCLCRLDRKIPGQSNRSNEFNRMSATECITAAQEQLALIPDEPNAVGLLRTGPWMSILHLIVQSVTVLTLEISFRAHHMPQQADDLIESAKKGVRWLHALGDDNLAAARAWRLCSQMLQGAAVKMGRVIDDMPEVPPRTAGTTSDDTSMSGGTVTDSRLYDRSSGHNQAHQFGANYPATTMPYAAMNMSNMSAFVTAGSVNPFADIHDQYGPYPGASNLDPSQMHYSQSPPHMQYGSMPMEADMSFMNQYTE